MLKMMLFALMLVCVRYVQMRDVNVRSGGTGWRYWQGLCASAEAFLQILSGLQGAAQNLPILKDQLFAEL